MTRSAIGLALFAGLVLSSCRGDKADKPTSEPDNGSAKSASNPTETATTAPQPAPAPVLKIGVEASVAAIASTFPPGTKIIEEVESAEGDPVGKMFPIELGGKVAVIAHAKDTGPINRIEYYGNFTGPDGVEPGKSTFAETDEALALSECNGGADAWALKVFCKTRIDGVTAMFPSSIDTAELQLKNAAAAKAIGEKPLEALVFGGAADTAIMTSK